MRDTFAQYRDAVLDRAAAAEWPEIVLEGLGRVAGESGWIVAVEGATADELIVLSRALQEHTA